MVDNGPTTSLSLLQRVKNNDAQAWSLLRDLYLPLVFQWCRWSGIPDDDIPDIGQETFIAIARSIGSFQKTQEGQSFRGWLRTITNSKIADWGRRHRRNILPQGGSDALRQLNEIPESLLDESLPRLSEEQSILYARVMELMGQEFPQWYQAAFIQLVVDHKTPQEVATESGRRVSAIYNAKARILKRIREEFDELIK